MESHWFEDTSKAHLPNEVLVKTGCSELCEVLCSFKDGHPTPCPDNFSMFDDSHRDKFFLTPQSVLNLLFFSV